MSHIVGNLSHWAQQHIQNEFAQAELDTTAVTKAVTDAIQSIAGLVSNTAKSPYTDKGLRKFTDADHAADSQGPVKYLLDHPLGGQRDRVVTSAGLCAEHSDIYVHAENSAIYLPGKAADHGIDPNQPGSPWPCLFEETATKVFKIETMGTMNGTNFEYVKNIEYLTNYQYGSSGSQTWKDSNLFLTLGGLHKVKTEEGKDCRWEIETVTYKADRSDKDGVNYVAFQSLLPSFPMARVQTKEHEKQLAKQGIKKWGKSGAEEAFVIGDSAPDIVGFYLQWANCHQIVMQMICDEYESPFMLDSDKPEMLAEAAQGVLSRYKTWAVDSELEKAFEAMFPGVTMPNYFDPSRSTNIEGIKKGPTQGYTRPADVIEYLQQFLPSASDSYMFQASKAPVHYDPHHPLALCNLNCHYQHWVMKCLDIMSGEQYPTMGMIRAYALADDTFRRGARKMKTAGMFYQWPAGPLMRLNAREKGVKLVTDRDAVEEAMKRFTIPERIAFLARFVFDVVIDVKLKLRAAAASLEGKPGKKDSMKKFEAAVQGLIKDHQPYLFLFLDYASRMAGKQARAEELGFGMDAEQDESKKLPKDLEGYEVFADPVMGQTLSVTIASGTWVTHTLYRAPHKFGKSNARGISDADIQLMLAAADKHGLDKDFAIRLQKRIAQTHDDVFVNASILDGMCKHIKGQSIEMYDVQTQQPVPSDMWKWSEVKSDGSRSLDLTDAGKKKYGANWRERLVPDCKHLMMVFPDDAMNPQILPHPPMSGEAVFRFLERAKETDAGNNLFMKIQKRYQKVEPHTVIEAAKGAYESSNPYKAKIAATRARSDRRHWSGPVSSSKDETL